MTNITQETTYNNTIEHAIQWALEDILDRKQRPSQEDLAMLEPGSEAEAIISSLISVLRDSDENGIKHAFVGLSKKHPWLGELKSKPVPPRPGTEDEQKTERKPQRRIRFVDDDAIENMPAREWLVSGILPEKGIAMLYGPPGTYKSFLAIDWALCIGYGYGWLGRAVKQGGVAYIAGEGSFGLGPRVKAWKGHHHKQGNSGVKWYGQPIALTDPASVLELVAALEEDFAENLKLLIIDTLSRNSGGADENSNTEMAKIIAAADMLQEKFGCAVLVVHHVGKDKQKGPRGASSLVGNMETIISTDLYSDAVQGIKIECFKQKDAEQFDPIHLSLHKVVYGKTPDESSIVLVHSEPPLEDEEDTISSKKSVQAMYEVLIGKELTMTEWVALGATVNVSERSAKRARKELYDSKRVHYKTDSKRYYVPTSSNSTDSTAIRGDDDE